MYLMPQFRILVLTSLLYFSSPCNNRLTGDLRDFKWFHQFAEVHCNLI